MRFLLRMTFWFALVLYFLPLGSKTETGKVDALEAANAARQAIQDVAGMCERQPDVCVTGKAALRTIGERARDTANAVSEQLDKTLESGEPDVAGPPMPTPRPVESVGSIKAD